MLGEPLAVRSLPRELLLDLNVLAELACLQVNGDHISRAEAAFGEHLRVVDLDDARL